MPSAGDRSSRTPRATRRRIAATSMILAILVVLAGCSTSADQLADNSTPASGDTTAPAPSDGSTDGSTAPARDCGGDLAAIDAVIAEQLAAFVDEDWDRAFALTSRRFRASGIDADGLREIVMAGYAEAADAESHEVLGCVRTRSEAQVRIEVTATDGATLGLVYLMSLEDGGWRISGAVEHGTGGSEPTTIPA